MGNRIEEENRIFKLAIPFQKRKQLELLYYFEIHKTKNEIIAAEKFNLKVLKWKFLYLDGLVTEEIRSGIRLRKMLSIAYRDILFSFLFSNREQIKQCAVGIYGLFKTLAGPGYTKITREDIHLLNESVDLLEILASYAGEFNKTNKALSDVCAILFNLGEIAHWYQLLNLKTKIFRALNKVKKMAISYQEGRKSGEKERLIRVKAVNDTVIKLQEIYKTKAEALI